MSSETYNKIKQRWIRFTGQVLNCIILVHHIHFNFNIDFNWLPTIQQINRSTDRPTKLPTNQPTNWLTKRLSDRATELIINNWLTDCLTHSLTYWLIDWLKYSPTQLFFTDFLTNRLTDWLTDLLIGRLTDQPTKRPTKPQINQPTNQSTHKQNEPHLLSHPFLWFFSVVEAKNGGRKTTLNKKSGVMKSLGIWSAKSWVSFIPFVDISSIKSCALWWWTRKIAGIARFSMLTYRPKHSKTDAICYLCYLCPF